MAQNLIDYLIEDCMNPASYPAKLRYTQSFSHSLRNYAQKLDERAAQVFRNESKYWRLRFWECYDGQSNFPAHAHDCQSLDQLQQHLFYPIRKDPKSRHVFVEAPSSWEPLDCSREMLGMLLNFHQVMPQFLEMVLSFGKMTGLVVPTAYHHCHFRHEHLLGSEDARLFNIPQLGRSGNEIRHCYNLWSAEPSYPANPKQCPLTIRQAGIYHSFDINSGRSTWIHVKANDVLQERIREATTSAKQMRAEDMQTLEGAFTASLMTQLIMFEWCGEGWRQYLSHWEREIDSILTMIKQAPISEAEKALLNVNPTITNIFEATPHKRQLASPPQKRRTADSRTSTWKISRENTLVDSVNRAESGFASVAPTKTALQNQGSMVTSPQPAVSGASHDPLQVFEKFMFKDLQRLHFLSSKLQEADMILRLNKDILVGIVSYYESYMAELSTPEAIRKGCQQSLSRFTKQITGIIQDLQLERTRIGTLIILLDEGKALFHATTQFRNVELNRLSSKRMEEITEEMHESTLQMKSIAEKTKKETASMHIITWVTLIFLPETFVATFFGAGFFQWPDSDQIDNIPTFPTWRPQFFFLFAKITVGLMVLSILVWLAPRLRQWVPWRDIWMSARGLRPQADIESQQHGQKGGDQ
ncbi:hypothetical protein F4808DRAFT_421310 [Astrocystis sublimbata]|nr:hypothetical protein F4808DRAFT_421310 [Astrocystis sublimbata]